MSRNTALCGHKDSELQALKHELEVEILNDSKSIDAEFHDHEDLVYERQHLQLSCYKECLYCLNVRGGDFLHE